MPRSRAPSRARTQAPGIAEAIAGAEDAARRRVTAGEAPPYVARGVRRRRMSPGGSLELPVVVDVAGGGDVRRSAPRGPALVVDRDGVQRHVRVRMLDVALQDGDVSAEPHRPDARLVEEPEQFVLELGDERVAVARPDRPHDRLLR